MISWKIFLMFCFVGLFFYNPRLLRFLHVLFCFIQIWDKYFYFQYVEIESFRGKKLE